MVRGTEEFEWWIERGAETAGAAILGKEETETIGGGIGRSGTSGRVTTERKRLVKKSSTVY